MQRRVLERLMHPIVLSRLLDAEVTSRDPMRIGALFEGLRDAIWEETAAKGASLEINSHRRALQREHLRRLTGLLLSGENNPPEDARTQARASLDTLRARIRGILARPGLRMPEETRSHLQESLSRIEEALKAGVGHLLLPHIQENAQRRSQLQELMQVLPAMSRNRVHSLLDDVRCGRRVHPVGREDEFERRFCGREFGKVAVATEIANGMAHLPAEARHRFEDLLVRIQGKLA